MPSNWQKLKRKLVQEQKQEHPSNKRRRLNTDVTPSSSSSFLTPTTTTTTVTPTSYNNNIKKNINSNILPSSVKTITTINNNNNNNNKFLTLKDISHDNPLLSVAANPHLSISKYLKKVAVNDKDLDLPEWQLREQQYRLQGYHKSSNTSPATKGKGKDKDKDKDKDKGKGKGKGKANSNSNSKRNNTTAAAASNGDWLPDKDALITNLFPSEPCDEKERRQFWNDLRSRLRARLPQEFLFRILTQVPDGRRLHVPTGEPTDIMAIDCETVGVGEHSKSALARISIVNFNGEVVYDKFVRPELPITDYRTAVSGITKDDIKKLSIPFKRCQKEVFELLKNRRIIGHALDNDWRVLQCKQQLKEQYFQTHSPHLYNSCKSNSNSNSNSNNNNNNNNQTNNTTNNKKKKKIRSWKLYIRTIDDWSWQFDSFQCDILHKDKNKPWGLKFLMSLFLGIQIQDDCHDSVQDALSVMAIYRALTPEIKQWIRNKRKLQSKMKQEKKEAQKKKEKEKKRSKELVVQRPIIKFEPFKLPQNNILDTKNIPTFGLVPSHTTTTSG